MVEASRSYVRLPELLEKAGQRVAELAGVEAAYITTGVTLNSVGDGLRDAADPYAATESTR